MSRGGNDLPTNARMFGVVRVDTAHEAREAWQTGAEDRVPHLEIQLTRDRLVQNEAFENLRVLVRWGLDFYAHSYRRRQLEKDKQQDVLRVERKFDQVQDTLRHYEATMPREAYATISAQVGEAERAAREREESLARRANLLSALASTGMAALAYQHEIGNMYRELEVVASDLRATAARSPDTPALEGLASRLESWIERSKATRALFSHLLDEEDREERARFGVRPLVEQVFGSLGRLARRTRLDVSGVDEGVQLPRGTFAEWTSVFQNVFLNTINAMLDTPFADRVLCVETREHAKRVSVVVQDTGSGVDLRNADKYFEAFERGLDISPERRALGAGGSGLGLAIVRTIAENLGGRVAFVEPSEGYATAFELSWGER